MTYINITKFVLINKLEKDHSMIETYPIIVFQVCELDKQRSFIVIRKKIILK